MSHTYCLKSLTPRRKNYIHCSKYQAGPVAPCEHARLLGQYIFEEKENEKWQITTYLKAALRRKRRPRRKPKQRRERRASNSRRLDDNPYETAKVISACCSFFAVLTHQRGFRLGFRKTNRLVLAPRIVHRYCKPIRCKSSITRESVRSPSKRGSIFNSATER